MKEGLLPLKRVTFPSILPQNNPTSPPPHHGVTSEEKQLLDNMNELYFFHVMGHSVGSESVN
ncbi:MAG: hypothetical protein EBV05_14020 [Cyanobacteria bacterium WB6_1B_304]|nr:hypothetical protein [Cyanobacteria bacterium WB6_1B_304]